MPDEGLQPAVRRPIPLNYHRGMTRRRFLRLLLSGLHHAAAAAVGGAVLGATLRAFWPRNGHTLETALAGLGCGAVVGAGGSCLFGAVHALARARFEDESTSDEQNDA